ncbi:tetratricopeptide repeat protein [Prochlorococcus marinus]|uniref:tetratricopeptide repeat protein n=1 Tax=Prochlorococcus marinus TaxID=1219 RepID=UPI0022B55755|nr:tetratricopeptide repeat protein [Prochlorococcus marinus]
MEGYSKEEEQTFSDPLVLGKIKESVSISTNTFSKPSKEQLIHKAFKFHSEGNIEEATKHYQYFMDQGFEDPIVFANYGIILKKIGNLEEAELLQRKAIQIKPDYVIAHSNLGNILNDLGKLEEAESSHRKAIEIKPDFANAHYNLGNILNDLGKLEEAESSHRKAIEIKPDFANAHYNLGITLSQLNKLKEAKISILKAIELKPDFAEAYKNLGSILNKLGKYQEAVEPLRKVIELNPHSYEANFNLASVLSNFGNLQEAESSLRKAIELKPDFFEAAWNLHSFSNDIQEAERQILRCLEIDQNNFKAKFTFSALQFHQGDQKFFHKLIKSTYKNDPSISSLKWVSTLPNLPKLFFNKWTLFDNMVKESKKERPFYEFGVWRGASFQYLINTFKKGYGFDTFEGLPEEWNTAKKGTFSTEGIIPQINGGTFISGNFEETLPKFFTKPQPKASIINFDADLYSSTICALTNSKPIIDEHTILIFDEFIMYQNWERHEYKALHEFCSENNLSYEVLAISYNTRQVALKLLGI